MCERLLQLRLTMAELRHRGNRHLDNHRRKLSRREVIKPMPVKRGMLSANSSEDSRPGVGVERSGWRDPVGIRSCGIAAEEVGLRHGASCWFVVSKIEVGKHSPRASDARSDSDVFFKNQTSEKMGAENQTPRTNDKNSGDGAASQTKNFRPLCFNPIQLHNKLVRRDEHWSSLTSERIADFLHMSLSRFAHRSSLFATSRKCER